MAKPRIPKNLTVAELNKLKPGQLTGAQKGRINRLLGNPGTRKLLADRFLSPIQQATRKVNTRLAQPVVEGSTVTNRDLARQRQSASSLRYGGAEAQGQRDVASRQQAVGTTGGYFDSYLAELRAHEANQAQINAQSQAATQGLAGSIQGLGQQAGQVVSQDNQSLQAATGASPASITQDASNASMLRQALTASFGAMLAGQGANASSYADTLAHVVGPGQKLQGLTRAQGDVTKARQGLSDLAKEKGAFEQQFEDEFKANESKNVLAQQIATGKTALEEAKLKQDQQKIDIAAQTLGVNAAGKAATTPEAKEAAKYGRSLHDWRLLGPKGRQSVKDAQARKDAQNKRRGQKPGSPDVITSGAFAGYTKRQVAAMSPGEKDRLKSDYDRGKGKGKPKAGEGPDWRTPEQSGAAMTQLTSLKSMAAKIKNGEPLVPGHARQTPLDRRAAGQKILGFAPVAGKLKDPVLVSAALDAAYDNHLSAETVKRLIAAGYKPSQVAQTLGVRTAANYRAPRRPTRPTRTGPGSNIPIPALTGPGVSPNA